MSTFVYQNFDLLIERWDENTYRARATDAPAGDAPPVFFTLPFHKEELEHFFWLSDRLLRDLRPPDAVLEVQAPLSPEEFGERLFEAVFAGRLGVLFHKSLQAAQSRNARTGERRLDRRPYARVRR